MSESFIRQRQFCAMINLYKAVRLQRELSYNKQFSLHLFAWSKRDPVYINKASVKFCTAIPGPVWPSNSDCRLWRWRQCPVREITRTRNQCWIPSRPVSNTSVRLQANNSKNTQNKKVVGLWYSCSSRTKCHAENFVWQYAVQNPTKCRPHVLPIA